MGDSVMKGFGSRWTRSVGMLALAAVASGCSSDVTRLTDGFYSGAAPRGAQPAQQQMAQAPYGSGTLDATNTGSIGQTYPVASAGYATSPVERSQLPPPPAAYQSPGAPGMATTANVPPAYGQPAPAAVAALPAASPSVPSPAAPAPVTVAATPAITASGRSVTVQSGDSLNAIARRTGVSVADLRAANGLAGDNIRIGQTLNLPAGSANTQVAALGAPPTTLQAQAAATPAPAVTAPVAAAQPAPAAPAPVIAAAPAAATPAASATPTTLAAETQTAALAPASTGISQFRWPVQGRVVKGFGDRVGSRRNDGLNISVPQGSPVKAAENGVVIYAGEGLKEFGKTVLIKHDNGLVTVYGHADEILVQRGATVTRGQDIAKAGMTGEADVPMLHFEVRKDSTPVDPMTYL